MNCIDLQQLYTHVATYHNICKLKICPLEMYSFYYLQAYKNNYASRSPKILLTSLSISACIYRIVSCQNHCTLIKRRKLHNAYVVCLNISLKCVFVM